MVFWSFPTLFNFLKNQGVNKLKQPKTTVTPHNMNGFSLLLALLYNLRFIYAEVVVDRLPSLNINVDEIDPNDDIFYVEINTNEDFNIWLNDTNYLTTHYSLIYIYNSDDDNAYANVHDYVSTELKSFSRNMLETRHNIINKNCYLTELNDDSEYEYETIKDDDTKATGFFHIDTLLQCQENIKTLTFVVDTKDIDMGNIEIISENENRLIIFPPTITLHEYYKEKYQIQSSMFWDIDESNDEESNFLLLENIDDIDDFNDSGQLIEEELQLSGAEKFERFINKHKFSILGSEYIDEVVFFEYEDLQLERILDNFNDWRFKLWDYLAKTLVIYISIPSSMQEQTNTFLYYFVIFFAILMVLKKKVLPYITKREDNENVESKDDQKSGKQVLFMFILFSFMIIISSVTGYQFVKLNSIVLLVKDEETNDLVYFAGTFNWQFGMETAIISVIYLLLMYMMLLILKKSREMDTVDEREDETKPEIAMNLVSILAILYLLKFVSHDVLTINLFKRTKYNNSYAY